MADLLTKFNIRRKAESVIAELANEQRNVYVVHYSCESLNKEDGSSPRITAISIRSLDGNESQAFSIHLEAEEDHLGVDPKLTDDQYDALEKSLLKKYYDFVEHHPNAKWVHWKMRDDTYGFPAIDHRARILKVAHAESPSIDRRFDLSELVEAIYGHEYTKDHPHIIELIRLNGLTDKDLIPGKEEPDYFASGRYRALHISAIRKTSVLRSIFQRVYDKSLITDASDREMYGSTVIARVHRVRQDPRYEVVELVLAVVGILSLILLILSGIRALF